MAKFKKLLIAALSVTMLASIGTATAFVSNDNTSWVTASAATTLEGSDDITITAVDQSYNTAACFTFSLTADRTGNGTSVTNKKKVGAYIYYNKQPLYESSDSKGLYFDVHMRSNQFWFYANGNTVLTEGDTITFQKGMAFPVVTADNESYSTFKDTLGETVVFKWDGTKWINQTEVQKEAEPKVKVTGIASGMGNGQSLNTNMTFPDTGNDHNYTTVEDWAETSGYILYNGATLEKQFDVHMMSGNFYIYPNTGFSFAVGDTVTILEGLHLPANATASYGSLPAYTAQTYYGYISETYTVELTDSGWVKKTEDPEALTIGSVGGVKSVDATATLPATYQFKTTFDLRVSSDEAAGLEKTATFADNVLINGKSVTDWNKEFTLTNEDGDPIPAIALSAYGTDVTVSIVQSTNIVDFTKEFSITFKKDIVTPTANYIAEDVTRYYIQGLEYWTNLQPYEITKTNALTIASVSDFALIDNDVNGAFVIAFNEEIATKQLLAYNFHPEYMKTLPAAYPVDKADDFAASGATENFINNVIINGKSIAEYWKDLTGAQAKSQRFECHILDTKTLRIGTAASNGFSGNDVITIVLKAGLTFFDGAYLDKDVTITYTPESGETAATTTYSIKASAITVTADKTTLTVGETATLTATIAPTDATETAVTYTSSDEAVATVAADGTVTAVAAGTVTITAKVGNVEGTVTLTVSAPTTGGNEGGDNGGAKEEPKSGCGSSIVGIGAAVTLLGAAAVVLAKKKND